MLQQCFAQDRPGKVEKNFLTAVVFKTWYFEFCFFCSGKSNYSSRSDASSSKRPNFSTESGSQRFQPYESRSRSGDKELHQARRSEKTHRESKKRRSKDEKKGKRDSQERKRSRRSRRDHSSRDHGSRRSQSPELVFNDVHYVKNPQPVYWSLGLLELPIQV